MRYFVASLLLVASMALPSCMLYYPQPAVVVTRPVVVGPRPYCHMPRGNAYGWRAHHGYYGYYGGGYGAPYGNPGYGHGWGPRR